jgi:hypothetical protein
VDLNDPTTVAVLAAEAFERGGHPYALYGGLLVAAYGEPRETRDADFAVIDMTLADAAKALNGAGVETQPAFEAVRFGGLLISRLTLPGSPAFTGLNTIDLVRPRRARFAAGAVTRAESSELLGRRVKVLAIEDFLLFKALSTRDRDLGDAASAMRRSGDIVDAAQVDAELSLLAAELPDVDIKLRYTRILEQARSQPA